MQDNATNAEVDATEVGDKRRRDENGMEEEPVVPKNIKIFDGTKKLTPADQPKTTFRSYFLTVNTNTPFPPNMENRQAQLDVAKNRLKNTFLKIANKLDDYVDVMGISSRSDIKNIDVESAMEVGPEKHHLHLHAMIKIEVPMRKKTSVAYGKFQKDFNQLIGFTTKCFFDPVVDNKMTVLEYINKNVAINPNY